MSRDSEKVLKELQKFLDAHAEDTEREADVDALAERFFAEYNLKCKEQKESAPETADDYLDLAEQVTSKKKSVEYLHKALELEPVGLDARLQLILRTAEQPDGAAACPAGAARTPADRQHGKVRRVQGVRR